VQNITAGTHTIQCAQELDQGPFTGTFVFEVSEEQGRYPPLSSGVGSRIHPYTSEDGEVDYLLYVLDDYRADSQKEWPLLVILHGRSRASSDVISLEDDYTLNTLAEDGAFSFVVVAPKSKIDPNIGEDYDQWASDMQVQMAMTVLDEVQAELSIDPKRVYLTGGSGVWVIGTRYPDRFAALVPFMGYYGWPFTVPENIYDIKDIPVWAFHGDADEVVPLEAGQNIVDALKACGGNVKFTIFPDLGHDLSYDLIYNAELYKWLLSHSLE
jgi:predicted peptidase